MVDAAGLLRLLGDEARLRLLRLLSREALNVSELTDILGLAQSGVSRHLGLLKDAGVVVEQRSGTFSWYRLAPELAHAEGDRAALWAWLRQEHERVTTATRADDARLAEVRRVRQESFAAHGAGDERRQQVPGRSWAAWSRALGLLLPPLDVADLGCGEGHLTIETAHWARKVIAVDRSVEVLARARALAARRKIRNIIWRQSDFACVPVKSQSVDVVLLSQALHHAEQPAALLSEARRLLRPGGRVLILELREHQETWVRQALGDHWLGFTELQLRSLLTDAGFTDPTLRLGARRRSGDPFAVIVATARLGTAGAGAPAAKISRSTSTRPLSRRRTT
jgi:SAM-dependent methyltransferase